VDNIELKEERSSEPTGSPSRKEVWKMFDRIAGRYDLLNRMLSFGRDQVWRKRLVRYLPPGEKLRLLDLATGTGDVAITLCDSSDRIESAVGIDMAEKMLNKAKEKIASHGRGDRIQVRTGNAMAIPFDDCSFDVSTIAFGVRNLSDVPAGLREMYRVLRPGGRMLILEFSLPPDRVVRAGYLLYFRHILPAIGGIISGDRQAYRYLNRTVETFPYGQEFCDLMEKAGFKDVKKHRLTFGIATIYEGTKAQS